MDELATTDADTETSKYIWNQFLQVVCKGVEHLFRLPTGFLRIDILLNSQSQNLIWRKEYLKHNVRYTQTDLVIAYQLIN